MAEGTFLCPILWCGQSTQHSHSEEHQQQLVADRQFLATAPDLPDRAVAAAKLLRRELAGIQGVGPRDASAKADEAFRRLGMARQTLETELFYRPAGLV